MNALLLKRTAIMTGACVAAATAIDFVVNGVLAATVYTPWVTIGICFVVAGPTVYYIQRQRLKLQSSLAARDAAEAASAAKSAFLASMSHELRTPLNAIIGYSELMQEAAVEENRQADVDDHARVLRSSRHLLSLINDVLDFSRIEADKLPILPAPFDVADLARDAAGLMEPAARQGGNALELSLGPNLGEAVSDRLRLNQCLLNLMSNAAKFTRQGSIELDVRRHAAETGDMLVFTVRDSGVGIAPEALPRLFKAFEQADISITRDFGGAGLGLAITRRLARLMGGDVVAQSVVGEGSTFILRVPARCPGAPANDPANAAGGPSLAAA